LEGLLSPVGDELYPITYEWQWPEVLLYLGLKNSHPLLRVKQGSVVRSFRGEELIPFGKTGECHDVFRIFPASVARATSYALEALRRMVHAVDDPAGGEANKAGHTGTGGAVDLHRKRFAELAHQLEKLFASIEDFSTDPPQLLDDLNPDDFLAWRVKARNLLAQACGVESEHYKEFLALEERSYRKYFEMLDSLSAVFSAAREDYEGGYVQSAGTSVQEDEPAGGGEAMPQELTRRDRNETAKPPIKPLRVTLTATEAADYVGVSDRTMRTWITGVKVTAESIGGTNYEFLQHELDTLRESQKHKKSRKKE